MSVDVYIDRLGNEDRTMNVANGNFYRIMDLVGATVGGDDGLCGQWDGQSLLDLRASVVFALESIEAQPALDGGLMDVQVRPNFFEGGLPEGYFRRRLNELLALIDVARSLNVPLHYA